MVRLPKWLRRKSKIPPREIEPEYECIFRGGSQDGLKIFNVQSTFIEFPVMMPNGEIGAERYRRTQVIYTPTDLEP